MESKGCVEIYPESPPEACVIWLHGLGANGHDFEPIVPFLKIKPTLPIWYIFPHAPSIPVTINNNFVMPAWYDIYSLERGAKIDEKGIRESADRIKTLIGEVEERGVTTDKIIIAGFSQGGVVAIETALTYPKKLSGLISISSYFPTFETIKPHENNAEIPILICHGKNDAVVQESMGDKAYSQLKDMGYEVQYKTYLTEHSVIPEELLDIGSWVTQRLSTQISDGGTF